MASRFAPRPRVRVSIAYEQRLGYNVLLDAGTAHRLTQHFPYAACFVPADFKLRPKAKDERLVARAETDKLLFVTHDTYMDEYVVAHQAGKKLHKCLNGLVLIPSGFTTQSERLGAVRGERRRLMFEGIQLYWYDIWQYNFFAHLEGRTWPRVTPLCDCGLEQFQKDRDTGRLFSERRARKHGARVETADRGS